MGYTFGELKQKERHQLERIASELGVEVNKKPNYYLIKKILEFQAAKEGYELEEGVLDIVRNKETQKINAFLRFPQYDYYTSNYDVYVPMDMVYEYNLKKGDLILGWVKHPDTDNQRLLRELIKIEAVNFEDPDKAKNRIPFEKLTPLYPSKKIRLERSDGDISMRIMDLFTPIGKGQRGLIVSPPKAGKTILLQKIARSVIENHPEIKLIILLIDERPEEVTDMRRVVPEAEIISSTFDMPPVRHIAVAEIVLERAKRLVEAGRDVMILLDSITRLARAYNAETPHSGKTLSGGIEATALTGPKRFFGAARDTEEGGSLTIIGTALIETGSKMDEVIFEEFKGTGNMELVLDRELSDRRIFPAIHLIKSGTRKEELLLNEKELNRVYILRRILKEMNPVEAMEFLKTRMERTKDNKEFLESMTQSE